VLCGAGSAGDQLHDGRAGGIGSEDDSASQWSGSGVFNMEQFDPDPFMAEIGDWGLPWVETFPQAVAF
jgi:saccharopine dehydrogenase-like NADP-dependent oxidoreductase